MPQSSSNSDYIIEFLNKSNSVCVGDSVNKRGTSRRHNYLYIYSPGGAIGVISFQSVVILRL